LEYQFQFGDVFASWEDLLDGAWMTIQLSGTAMLIGLAVAVVCAMAKTSGPRPLRWLVNAYVEIIRNTPFLVQIFLIFFGLPSLGLRLSPWQAALIAMVVNVGAYATEIIRAGIESIHKGQVEAGMALGLGKLQVFRYVVLIPALRAVYPALTSQFILLMLTSSVVSAISAEELTSVANDIQSQTFRSFEIYIVVTVMYLALSLMFSALFAGIYRTVFAYADRR
jgi:polar amino acid transport system permease protein